ncbi:aureocin A53 family class IId bacteriocin [Bacillus pumilus]|nr:aureocin A53 family class IId bacteriocin [Bacillus pumilus]
MTINEFGRWKNMVAFFTTCCSTGTKAAKWAWDNKSTVINWIKNGATSNDQ